MVTLDEMFAIEAAKGRRKQHNRHDEEQLQVACVRWFRLQYPKLSALFYHIPNEGKRTIQAGARAKAAGIVSGAPDLKLDVARHGYSTMDIELKTKTGKQSPNQKEWQNVAESNGHLYVVCRSLEEVMAKVNEYLKD